MNDPNMSQENPLNHDLHIDYFLPLSEFEKVLIHELDSLLNEYGFNDEQAQQISLEETFSKWDWAHQTRTAIQEKFEIDNMRIEYGGDRNKAYVGLLLSLKTGRLADQNEARVNEIDRINSDFILKLGNQPIENVTVRPLAQDIPFWNTITRILPMCKPFWIERPTTLLSSSKTFEILHLIKKFVLAWRFPFNQDFIFGLLINSPEFQAMYSVTFDSPQLDETQDVEDSDFEVYLDNTSQCLDTVIDQRLSIVKRTTRSEKAWPADEEKHEKNGKYTMEYLRYMLHLWEGHIKLADPRYYVHFIDWDDLKLVSEAELYNAGINIHVPFIHRDQSSKWFLWKPPHKGFIWNHHIHTEDEVFEYNLTHWPCPDHYLNDMIVFHASEMSTTKILGDLHNFWDDWNDCAITQLPENGPILLLETIPGMRFRARCQYQDQNSAMTYFRNLVEAHAAGPKGTQYLRDALGLEATYAPAFEHSLRIIREDCLSEISWEKPLGKGVNGVVFSALYHRPQGVLASSRAAKSIVPVVLKDVLGRSGNLTDARRKLVKELDFAFSRLGGRPTGCISFLGIAVLKRPHDDQNSATKEELFLVFERATRGPVLRFVLEYFKDMDFLLSWDKLIGILSSIGTGIFTLHKHDLLHRDLHMNNILVTDSFVPHEPRFDHEFKYLISDVGEGKNLREGVEFEHPSDNLASYGATEFRAPEVYRGEGWTPKAEIFSFGVIATKLLKARQDVCTTEPPAWVMRSAGSGKDTELSSKNDTLVPVMFREILEPCFQVLPDNRFGMKEILQQLNDLQGEFYELLYPEDETSSGSEHVSTPSIHEYNTESDLGSMADSDLPASEPHKEPFTIKWTYWNWERALQLARSPGQHNSTAVSGYNLDKPLAKPTLN